MMTRETADQFLCCGPRPMNTGIFVPSAVQPQGNTDDVEGVYVCSGPMCAAWRWLSLREANAWAASARPTAEAPKAFCGHAGGVPQ